MKTVLILMLFLGLAMSGCSSSTPTTGINTTALFTKNCAACHVTIADARQIAGTSTNLTISGIITNGRGGMPAFKNKLTAAQIVALTNLIVK
jgi:mono/diheme cytochrome c family protein